jgi:hypothetical protein
MMLISGPHRLIASTDTLKIARYCSSLAVSSFDEFEHALLACRASFRFKPAKFPAANLSRDRFRNVGEFDPANPLVGSQRGRRCAKMSAASSGVAV